MTDICFIADLHGNLPQINSCDILCICGDLVPLSVQGSTKETKKWVRDKFIPWVNKIENVEYVLIVPGNHDLHLKEEHFSGNPKIKWIIDKKYDVISKHADYITFYGTPWCHVFGNWAYMISDDMLKEKFSNIPSNVDFLLTHDAPYGTSDIILQDVPWNKHEHIGNVPLRDAIIEKAPKYCIHGHLHSTNHGVEKLNNTEVICCSVVDESYELNYKPLHIFYGSENQN